MLGGAVGPPIIGNVVGNIVGEKVGEKVIRDTGDSFVPFYEHRYLNSLDLFLRQ